MVVTAPPAHITPRSARIHSTRVLEDSATRCSGWIPRSMIPAAMANTRSAAWPQLSDFQSSGPPRPSAAGTG